MGAKPMTEDEMASIVERMQRAARSAADKVSPTVRELRVCHRGLRQELLVNWAEAAFGTEETASIPQRGLRLLEEAIEAFQACGGEADMAHKIVEYVFAQPVGELGQELGGVAVTTLLLAAAAGKSADEEECREIHRVLDKPLKEFTARNANKNAAGFKMPTQTCLHDSGTRDEGEGEYCMMCGQVVVR